MNQVLWFQFLADNICAGQDGVLRDASLIDLRPSVRFCQHQQLIGAAEEPASERIHRSMAPVALLLMTVLLPQEALWNIDEKGRWPRRRGEGKRQTNRKGAGEREIEKTRRRGLQRSTCARLNHLRHEIISLRSLNDAHQLTSHLLRRTQFNSASSSTATAAVAAEDVCMYIPRPPLCCL